MEPLVEPKLIMCFPNTGVGNEEIPYAEMGDVPQCHRCRFRNNIPMVAPCFDCQGHQETGRSYFSEMP